ncbi:NAD-dependent DNA ligase [Salmonella enterica]|nr:NAD-dependent DNA ligase [Salmonella enterica]EBA9761787.1 NAD-dependent DNA ligase [Salmonella enterica]EEB5697285.1 NAD-dependent DNA ligase [Salmonella enterica]ELF4899578.1 BRCT domain-containing protein [Salmonella enterica]
MDEKFYIFNYARNRDKIFANLISIIDGIMADGVINDEEILYLDTWLLEAKQLINNGVIKSLSLRVSDILADKIVTGKEREDIKWQLVHIQKEILDIPEVDLYSTEADVQLLSGLCKGLIADRRLSYDEVRYLGWWLDQNGALKSNYPGKEIYALVKDILSDGIITKHESSVLFKMLVDFTGCDLDHGVVDGLATRLPVDIVEDLSIQGRYFCLTGVFISGKRIVVEEKIRQAGGLIVKDITKKLDYLIIGTLSSRDWRFSSHGRKIEKAINYRDEQGAKLKILTEAMLFEALP